MKTTSRFTFALALAAGCATELDTGGGEPTVDTTPLVSIVTLDIALAAWAEAHGDLATVTSTDPPYPIVDAAALDATIDQILASPVPDFIDPLGPSIVTAPADGLDALEAVLYDAIGVGDDVVVVNWSDADGNAFTTLAIERGGYLQWENLTYLSLGIPTMVFRDSASDSGNWVWGSERGRFDAWVEAVCDPATGKPTSCRSSCTCSMQIGSAECKCDEPKIEGNCCKMKYAYALSTPLVSTTFNNDNWKFEVGGVGSCISGNGTLVDCCPPPAVACVTDGTPCLINADCCSDSCVANVCHAAPTCVAVGEILPSGEPCHTPGGCCSVHEDDATPPELP
jgi:hypothetical protein